MSIGKSISRIAFIGLWFIIFDHFFFICRIVLLFEADFFKYYFLLFHSNLLHSVFRNYVNFVHDEIKLIIEFDESAESIITIETRNEKLKLEP